MRGHVTDYLETQGKVFSGVLYDSEPDFILQVRILDSNMWGDFDNRIS